MILGIDPGITGGIAIISDHGIMLEPMPLTEKGEVDAEKLWHLIPFNEIKCAYVEEPFAMPKAGAASMLKFGMTVGIVHGVLACCDGMPFVRVRPQEWQKNIYRDCPKKLKGKERSVWSFERIFPGLDAIAPGCRKLHMGMVEAALIAHYGRRLMG